jgi:hypothetical protein
MSKQTILQRLAHYEDLHARFVLAGRWMQAEYAKKSVETLKRRLATVMAGR